jgi:hypothetical protein
MRWHPPDRMNLVTSQAGAAQLLAVLGDPKAAEAMLGGGKALARCSSRATASLSVCRALAAIGGVA